MFTESVARQITVSKKMIGTASQVETPNQFDIDWLCNNLQLSNISWAPFNKLILFTHFPYVYGNANCICSPQKSLSAISCDINTDTNVHFCCAITVTIVAVCVVIMFGTLIVVAR